MSFIVQLQKNLEEGRRKKKMEAVADSFPADIIINILANLPVKTLLRFKFVCKNWNSIIADQSFIKTHLLSQPEGLLFSHFYEPSSSSSSSDKTQLCTFFPDESFSQVHKSKVPLAYSAQQEPCRILVGSCNGLLCLTDWKPFGRVLRLWNLSLRKYKTLPNTCLFNGKYKQKFLHPKTLIVFGLGHRAHTGDYIVVRIAVFRWTSRRLKRKPLPLAEIYSLSSESWRSVDFPENLSKRLMNIGSWQYVYVNGDLNWIAMFSDEEGRSYSSILSFNVNKEEFREIRLPNDYKNGIHGSIQRFVLCRGLLGIIIYGDSVPSDGNRYLWIWVMEEYGKVDSWSRKRVKVEGSRFLHGCTSDGRIVFTEGRRRVSLFDADSLEEQELSLPAFQSMHRFKESLVSLEGANVYAS